MQQGLATHERDRFLGFSQAKVPPWPVARSSGPIGAEGPRGGDLSCMHILCFPTPGRDDEDDDRNDEIVR